MVAVGALVVGGLAGTAAISTVSTTTPAAAALPPAPFLDSTFGTNGVAYLTPGTSGASSAQATSVAPVPACPSGTSCPFSAIANDEVVAGSENDTGGGSALTLGVVDTGTGAPVTSFGGGLVTDHLGQPPGLAIVATGVAVYPPCPSTDPTCPWLSQVGDIAVVGTAAEPRSSTVSYFATLYSSGGALLWMHTFQVPDFVAVQHPSLALVTTGTAPTGDLVVGGAVVPTIGGRTTPLLAALTPAGVLDTGFGGSGRGQTVGFIGPVASDIPADEDLTGLTLDGAGDVIVTGTRVETTGSPSTIVVARLLPDGLTDTRFGSSDACASTSCAGSELLASSLGSLSAAAVSVSPAQVSCPAEGCYDILVAGTLVPSNGTPSSEVVAAVDENGAGDVSFGGSANSLGLITLPSDGTTGNADGTGIAVQQSGGIVTGVMVSGSVGPTKSTSGSAVVTLLSPTGGVVKTLGGTGTYAIPSAAGSTPEALAVADAPGTLDFTVAGTLESSGGTVMQMAVARATGVVVSVSATVARDAAKGHNAELLTITWTAPVPVPEALNIGYSVSAPGVTSLPNSGTATIASGTTAVSAHTILYFAPLIPTSTVGVTTSAGSGPTVEPAPQDLGVPAASPLGTPAPGYWMVTSKGGVFAFRVPFEGAPKSPPPSPIVGMAESGSGSGYWLATAAGGVYAFGVPFHGGLLSAPASPIVAIASDVKTGGYWLFSRNGHVYAFGAPVYGQGTNPNGPVTAAAAAPDGRGYWLATSKGSVYGYGPDAVYRGGASNPSSPIVSIEADLQGGGYWLLTSKGVVYAFDAPALGMPSVPNATSITEDPVTGGYWVSTASGAVYSYGAKFYGSAAPYHPNSPIIAILGR